jgi:hypothetical protein
MAAREHRVSRRVLLGAACALPATLAAGLPSSFPRKRESSWIPDQVRDDEKWQGALTRFRRAQSVLDAAAHEPDEDLYDAINGAFHNALRRLLRTPAPDLRALSLKIDLAVDQAAWELTGGEACMAALKRDARRLARNDRVRT